MEIFSFPKSGIFFLQSPQPFPHIIFYIIFLCKIVIRHYYLNNSVKLCAVVIASAREFREVPTRHGRVLPVQFHGQLKSKISVADRNKSFLKSSGFGCPLERSRRTHKNHQGYLDAILRHFQITKQPYL